MDETVRAVTEDHVLGGKVAIRQPAKGYRAGLDAALLAAACDAGPGQRVIEPGCGVGAVMLAAATRRPGAAFVGLEREPAALALAHQNIALNGLEGRVQALAGDVGAPPAQMLQPRGELITVYRDADPYLLPLAIVLLLGEVFVRRRYLGD